MYDPGAPGAADGLYVINVLRDGFRLRMHPLTDADQDGLLTVGKPVRDFRLGSEGEGCEVDDATGALYVSEDDVGIWRYDLTAPTGLVPPRVRFASVGSYLSPDIEGLALAGGVLYASSQNVAAPFPEGLFVCQDGFNDAPGTAGTQNFKYAPLQLVGGVA
jgi:3-phytase